MTDRVSTDLASAAYLAAEDGSYPEDRPSPAEILPEPRVNRAAVPVTVADFLPRIV